MSNDFVSKCCRKSLKVEGEGTTHWYSCNGCGQATDVVQKEAIVGVEVDGLVTSLFCIDSDLDEPEVSRIQVNWEKRRRMVRRCSQKYALGIIGKQWKEEVK